MRPVIGGRAGEDAVVIVGEALRFHEGLAAAVGAGTEIRMLRPGAIERRNDGFGPIGGLVDGAVAEIGNLFRMAERPLRIDGATFVAGVGAGGGISIENGVGHRSVIDGAGEASVADTFVAAVPTGRGQPDFEFDVGIAGWLDHALNAAERRELLVVEADLAVGGTSRGN